MMDWLVSTKSFSGVDMLMKAVGKDCTALFSILFWNFICVLVYRSHIEI